MIGINELHEKTQSMKTLAAAVTAAKDRLKSRIEEIEQDGRSEKWMASKKEEVRGQASKEIAALVAQINELHGQVAAHEKFWNDRELVLSKIPLTKRGADFMAPENPAGEAMARSTLLAEAARMSNARLAIMAEDAAASGNPAAAYLFALEGNSREKPAKIATADVAIPEQEAALALFHEARKTVAHAVCDSQEAAGARTDQLSVGRLNAERGIL